MSLIETQHEARIRLLEGTISNLNASLQEACAEAQGYRLALDESERKTVELEQQIEELTRPDRGKKRA